MDQKGGAERILLIKLINLTPTIDETDENGNNFLHYLSMRGDEDLLKEYLNKALIDGNIENIINKTNNDMETPLHLAVKNNNQEVCQILIDYGANKDLKDKNGYKVEWVQENQSGGGKKKVIYGNRKL